MTNASPAPLPQVLGFAVVVVHGRSMEPTLRDGDRLLVRAGRGAVRRARPGALVVGRLPGGRPLAVKRLAHLVTEGAAGEGWWVERDNAFEGVDSWQVGALTGDDRVAVVLARLAPRPRLLARLPRPRRAAPRGVAGSSHAGRRRRG